MNIFLILVIVAAIIASMFFLWATRAYNNLVTLKALVQEAWSGIDVQLKRRYDLVPNLVAVVKQYSIHEKSVLEQVTKMRSQAAHAATLEEKIGAEVQLTQALRSLMVVVEQYPELKANENFLGLQRDLAKLEQEIQLSRRYYNGTVRNYNIRVLAFPSGIVARMTGFNQAPYFELAHEHERENPRINF